MNQMRFDELADAYGADLARWPAPERPAAEARLANHVDARATLERASRLDDALSAYAPGAPSADLQRRIVSRLLAERRLSRRVAGWLAALAALAGAGALGAGATAGAAMVAVAPATPHLSRQSSIYEQSSFGDFGSADNAGDDSSGA